MEWGRMFPEKVSSIAVPRYVVSDVQVILPRDLSAGVAPVERLLRGRPGTPRTTKYSAASSTSGKSNASSSKATSSAETRSKLRIQVLDLARVLLDKGLARLHLVAHERREQLVGDRRGLDGDLQ